MTRWVPNLFHARSYVLLDLANGEARRRGLYMIIGSVVVHDVLLSCMCTGTSTMEWATGSIWAIAICSMLRPVRCNEDVHAESSDDNADDAGDLASLPCSMQDLPSSPYHIQGW